MSRFEQHRQLTGWRHRVLEFGSRPRAGRWPVWIGRSRGSTGGCGPGRGRASRGSRGGSRFDSVEYPDRGCWKTEPTRLYLKGCRPGAVPHLPPRHRRHPQDDDAAPRGTPLAGDGVVRGPGRRAPAAHRPGRRLGRGRHRTGRHLRPGTDQQPAVGATHRHPVGRRGTTCRPPPTRLAAPPASGRSRPQAAAQGPPAAPRPPPPAVTPPRRPLRPDRPRTPPYRRLDPPAAAAPRW